MKKLIFILVTISFFSCVSDNEKVVTTKSKNENLSSVILDGVRTEDSQNNEDVGKKLLKPNVKGYNQSIFNYIDLYVSKVKSKGYVGLEKVNTEQYKREQLVNDSFYKVAFEKQFDKGKNRIISFILYEYKDNNSAVELFNELAYHKYQDGIFKSGSFLIYHSKYLLQIASTCSISRESWNNIKEELTIELPHIYCLCGGTCTLEFQLETLQSRRETSASQKCGAFVI